MTTLTDHQHAASLIAGRSWLVAGLAIALTVMVLIPCLTPTTTVQYFESDPRLGPEIGVDHAATLTDLGPAAVAWLQTLTVGVAGLGWLAAVWAGARLNKIAIGLAALGMAAAAFHMTKTTARWEDWTQGGAWIAAAMAGLAGMHLAQHDAGRRWIVALVVAAAAGLLAEAGWYVWVEHPEGVRFFETHGDEILGARGITPGSEQAALYERRLRFADATGTFGLSNVLASVAATIALTALGVLLTGWRRRRFSIGPMIVAGLSMAAGLIVVGLTASKGAAVAIAAVLGLAGCAILSNRFLRFGHQKWMTPTLALVVVVCALGAVLVRGAMGPPAPPTHGFVADAVIEGERSLLFRAHYWSAAARIAADYPLMGSGSRGFADAYPAAKNPLNPETVTSTHNVLLDYITMLGVSGWAWAGLLLWCLWRAGRALSAEENTEPSAESPGENTDTNTNVRGGIQRSAVWAAVGAAVVLFSVTLFVRQSTLYLDSAVLWLVAIAGFVAIAAVLGSADSLSSRGLRLALFLGAAAALVHNQIEMAFFQPASMGLLWLIVGAAGAGKPIGAEGPMGRSPVSADGLATAVTNGNFSRTGLGTAGSLGLAVVIVMMIYLSGAAQHERAMAGAEAALRRGDTGLAQSRLAEAQDAAGLDTRALRWRLQIHALEPMARFVQIGQAPEAERRVSEAVGWVDDAIAAEHRPAVITRLRASILGQLAQQTRSETTIAVAESAYAELAEKSPYNIQDRMAWADLAGLAGDRDVAAERYKQVLQLREQKYLDSADPLTPEQLTRVNQALTALDHDAK